MSEARLLPWARVTVLLACYSGAGPRCSPASLKSGEIQCYSAAGKGLHKKEELHPLAAMQKKAVAHLHASQGAHRELGSSSHLPVAQTGGFQKPPFAVLPSWEMGLSLSLWRGCVTRAAGVAQPCQCFPCSQLHSQGVLAAGQCFMATSTQKSPTRGGSGPI